jgi:hypothetical protein
MATQWTAGTTSGQVLTAATLNTIGAAWVDYTPTLTQGVTVTKTVAQARYCQFQKTIIGQVLLNVTSAGTAATAVAIGLPFAVRTGTPMVGSGYIYDASTNVMYNCTFSGNASIINGFYQTGFNFGVSPAITLATSDQLSIQFSYEVA